VKHWSESFHNDLRETRYPGQIDIFQELEISPPYRPNVVCKKCAKPWRGEDARSTPAKARERKCWYVSHGLVRCPDCHQESK
jgi:hypothetical protein